MGSVKAHLIRKELAMFDTGYLTYFVSYERYEDDFVASTNIVHARSFADVEKEFESCSWYSARTAEDYEVAAAKAKGMPERWV